LHLFVVEVNGMKTILLAILAGLLGTASCRQQTSNMDDDGRATAAKPVETDDDFIQTRTTYANTMRERLDRLDARIDQLDSKTDPAGHSASIQLRARRDELAKRLKQVENQSESGWDRFESETTKATDQLEQDVDRLIN
jgi:TolA-binding protein